MEKIKLGTIALMAFSLLTVTSCKKKETTTPAAKDPVADFTADKTTGKTPLSVKFTNTSSDASKFSWDFGDGSSASTEKDPTHIFNNNSTTSGRSFTVTLKASNDAGKSSTTIKTINVDAKTVPPTPEEMLTGGPWLMTAYTEVDVDNKTTDVFAEWNDCQKDNIFIFKKGGDYDEEEGKTRCNVGDPTIYDSGTWTLTSDGKTLVMDGEEAEFLEALTATGMKIKFTDRDDPDDVVKSTITFKRQ